MSKEFKGEKYDANGSWTPEYDKWRRDNNLCNSPMAWVLMKREERRLEAIANGPATTLGAIFRRAHVRRRLLNG